MAKENATIRTLRGRLKHVHGSRRAPLLRLYLRAKARAGVWDDRMLGGHPGNVSQAVRRFIMRGFARGLVVTATTDGVHAPGSWHYAGVAADMGLVPGEVGTRKGRERLHAFQVSEARHPARFHELIGPGNNSNVKEGLPWRLVEGTALENQHDNHVHGALR